MLNLFGRLSFDGSSFTKAMAGMKAAAGPAGASIGQQIRGKMLEAFGAGAAIALFKKTIENAVSIRAGATKTGLDTSTFQALEAVAKNAGMSVDELAKIMAEGGDAGKELADAVAAARDEMESTGQLIDGETIDRLADLGDRFQQLFGRIAPGLAWIVDWLGRIYDIVGRGVQAAVGGAQTLFGQATGDSAMTEAGRELAREAFQSGGDRQESALRSAARTAARLAREESERETGGTSSRRGGGERAPEVSSLVAAGAVFGGRSEVSRTQEMINQNVQRIVQMLQRGRD